MNDAVELPSSDGVCAWHPRVRASTTCERCGSFACLDCFEIVHGRELCRECSRATAVDRAPRPRRFVARAIDHVLASVLVLAPQASVPAGSLASAASFAAALGVLFLVQGCLLVRRGQTIGKWTMGIAIRRPDGSRVSAIALLAKRELPVLVAMNLPLIVIVATVFAGERAAAFLSLLSPAFLRAAFGLTSLPATIDALSIFRDEERCLHDLFADTVVVVAPR